MRPIIALALVIIAILVGVFIYNISAPTHENLAGTYSYGGESLIIYSNNNAQYGNAQVIITEVRQENVFDLYCPTNSAFPSGRYLYSEGYLIGTNNGATFVKR